MKKIILEAIVFFVVLNLLLLASGYRVLIGKDIVQPGQHFVDEQWGDLGAKKTPTLVCSYWTGIAKKVAVWQYGADLTSRTSCNYFYKPA